MFASFSRWLYFFLGRLCVSNDFRIEEKYFSNHRRRFLISFSLRLLLCSRELWLSRRSLSSSSFEESSSPRATGDDPRLCGLVLHPRRFPTSSLWRDSILRAAKQNYCVGTPSFFLRVRFYVSFFSFCSIAIKNWNHSKEYSTLKFLVERRSARYLRRPPFRSSIRSWENVSLTGFPGWAHRAVTRIIAETHASSPVISIYPRPPVNSRLLSAVYNSQWDKITGCGGWQGVYKTP